MRAIYPGTFDPVTFGHIDLIKRAYRIFPDVIVAVAHNVGKAPLFSVEERMRFLRRATRSLRGVQVDHFGGLTVDYVKRRRGHVMIRGLRMLSDFEYEFQMALTNRKLANDVETVFLMPSEAYAYVSARLIKEAAVLGADLAPFVPSYVEAALRERLKQPAAAVRWPQHSAG
ncbi:MAG TPA: pantetheine-phosphate adenylyltransferase [bacterium]